MLWASNACAGVERVVGVSGRHGGCGAKRIHVALGPGRKGDAPLAGRFD